MVTDVRKLMQNDDVVGYRVNYKNVWYDISVDTAIQYNMQDKLQSTSTRAVKLHCDDSILRSKFELTHTDFIELKEGDILSEIAVSLVSSDAYYLMLLDVPVLYFNLTDFVIEILQADLLPFSLRGVLLNKNDMKSVLYYIDRLREFLSRRVLSLRRKNAKQILNLLKLSQSDDIFTRCSISLYCKSLSITDSYWVKHESSSDNWDSVNLYENALDESLSNVALSGVSYTPTTSNVSPELTTQGLFRKSWVRDSAGLKLYKSDDLDNYLNTYCEVIASSLIEEFKADHCNYRLHEFKGVLVASCCCLANSDISMVFASDIKRYCDDLMISFENFCTDIGGVAYHNMFVIDYLICNTDRHNENWGFFMSNITGELCGMIPLYDHNLALVSDVLGTSDDSMLSNFKGYSTLLEAAVNHFKDSSVDLNCNIDHINYHGFDVIKDNVKHRINKLKDMSCNQGFYS